MGYVSGAVVRGLMVGAVVLALSLFFTKLTIFSIWIVFTFLIFTSLLFSLLGLVNGIYAKKFDDVSIIPTFVLTPLTYLGGVFYPISVLPAIWQNISKLNPILYMINGFRYGFLGISDISVTFALVMVIVFSIILFGLCFYLLEKGVGLKE